MAVPNMALQTIAVPNTAVPNIAVQSMAVQSPADSTSRYQVIRPEKRQGWLGYSRGNVSGAKTKNRTRKHSLQDESRNGQVPSENRNLRDC